VYEDSAARKTPVLTALPPGEYRRIVMDEENFLRHALPSTAFSEFAQSRHAAGMSVAGAASAPLPAPAQAPLARAR